MGTQHNYTRMNWIMDYRTNIKFKRKTIESHYRLHSVLSYIFVWFGDRNPLLQSLLIFCFCFAHLVADYAVVVFLTFHPPICLMMISKLSSKDYLCWLTVKSRKKYVVISIFIYLFIHPSIYLFVYLFPIWTMCVFDFFFFSRSLLFPLFF